MLGKRSTTIFRLNITLTYNDGELEHPSVAVEVVVERGEVLWTLFLHSWYTLSDFRFQHERIAFIGFDERILQQTGRINTL